MSENTPTKTASGQYAAAHEAHYSEKNLPSALGLYLGVLNVHPDAPEAGYSRSQIYNIVAAVVPRQELFDAHVRLALAHLDNPGPGAATAPSNAA